MVSNDSIELLTYHLDRKYDRFRVLFSCMLLQTSRSVISKWLTCCILESNYSLFVSIKQFFAKKHWIDPELTMIRNPLNDCMI